MRLVVFTLLVCIWTFPSMAQQSMHSLCQELSTYIPIDGVEFNPRAAEVPVDLNAVQDPVYGSIHVPVEIDLAEYFDRPDLRVVPGLNLEPDVSDIIVNQDGSVFYNGQEISANIRRTCGASGSAISAKPKPKAKPKAAKPKPKKSSVRVFNGPKAVITEKREVQPEKPAETAPVTEKKKEPEKPETKAQNVIDVEELETQNNTDDSDLIEGQYP